MNKFLSAVFIISATLFGLNAKAQGGTMTNKKHWLCIFHARANNTVSKIAGLDSNRCYYNVSLAEPERFTQ